MDEGSADAGVAMATEECVGVAMIDRALTVLINLVITAAVSVEGRRVMEDVGHTAGRQKKVLTVCLQVLLMGSSDRFLLKDSPIAL